MMRCDDIFERSEKINNSQSWKKSDSLLIKSNKSWQLNTSLPNTPPSLTLPFPSPLTSTSFPQTPNRRCSRRARMALGLCWESWREVNDFFLILMHERLFRVMIHLWMLNSKNGFFLPKTDQLSLSPDSSRSSASSVTSLEVWQKCELINYLMSDSIRLHICSVMVHGCNPG